ncbi:substrate-binding domain-containing protein [Pelagovum pacificum]|uniref:LacI family DNA-binding transcriptional regulator n=1 Tax=Pelagovum pacificum TaxID=2588711 RepID=A0A5C5GGA6_9RHOB|nr:substrate-binding domain-containing protein [Pelagovum pacificum]QQA43821.1 substrate-binding domain-containing protein [Pelagovum pacificum]TNY33049.1 LacI family DNA-binding transcriptional regulator [Pelagovum pacificum]
MAGIRQLAERLDISIGTVSRALNNKPDVKKETRERVLKMALEMGYRPNQMGRALRRGSTNTIGFVMEIGNPSALGGDNFFMGLLDSVQEVLAKSGFDLVLLPCRSADDPIEFLQRQIARGVADALVISATRRHDPRIELLLKTGTPFLALGRSETKGDYPWIDLDFEGVAGQSVRRLAAMGHNRIAIAMPRRSVNLAHLFLQGYRSAVADLGLDPDPDLVQRVSSSENGGMALANRLMSLDIPPTAVILAHELMASGLYDGLQQGGLRPGHDMSIIGFRQNPQLRYLRPSLACHALSLQALGQAVGRRVLALVDPPESDPPSPLVWEMDYIEGDSVRPLIPVA